MFEALIDLIMDRAPAIVVAMAENPAGADKLIILAALAMMFYLALRGRR